MDSTVYRGWLYRFNACCRRVSRLDKFKYANNVPLMRNTVLKEAKTLKHAHDIQEYTGGELFNLPADAFKRLMLQDINSPEHSIITVSTLNRQLLKKGKIDLWRDMAPLFINSLSQRWKMATFSDIQNRPFEYTQKLSLESVNETKKLENVLWPRSEYSDACRGVGVDAATYKSLGGDEKPIFFINPSNGTRLRLYQIDSVPLGYHAMGLFPLLKNDQMKYFTGLDALVLKVKPNICVKLPDSVTTEQLKNEEPKLPTVNLLYAMAQDCPQIWSGKDKLLCPADIIRNCVINKVNDKIGIEIEAYKHFIFYSVFALDWLLKRTVVIQDQQLLDTSTYSWKPWDLYIWKEHRKLSQMPYPHTWPEVESLKLKFDEFLIKLGQYSYTIGSEIKKHQRDFFFSDDIQQKQRVMTIIAILNEILYNTPLNKIVYPSLQRYFNKRLSSLNQKVSVANIDLLNDHHESLEMMETASKIMEELLIIENEVAIDPKSHERTTLTDGYKIVICSKLTDPIVSMLRYSTNILTIFVRDMENLELYGKLNCIHKKMIDPTTLISVYKDLKVAEPAKHKEELIDNILTKLTKLPPH